jgi:serine/threonine-protein kinase
MSKTAAVLRAQARGLFFTDRRTAADLDKAVEEFRRAIAVEPRFAEPHAALAEAIVRRMEMTNDVGKGSEREARREAARALALDPQSPLAHAARASIRFVLDRDMAAAEGSFRRAIEIDPSIPSVRRRYGYLLAANGRFAEAVTHTRAAAELAPTSSSTFVDLGWVELLAGEREAAQRDLREAARLDPTSAGAAMAAGYCHQAMGQEAQAWSEYRRGLALASMPAAFVAASEAAYAREGMRGVYASWASSAAKGRLPRFAVAFYAAQAGHSEEALAMLRQSVERREPLTLWIRVHPAFAALHHDAAFLALVRGAGLGDAAY